MNRPAFKKTEVAPLALFLAVALRETWEEMGLNPLNIKFLGMLPEQGLIVFDRSIFPMVGWLDGSHLACHLRDQAQERIENQSAGAA